MFVSKNKIKFLVLLIIASVLILSACGNGSNSITLPSDETVEAVSVDGEAVSPNQPETEMPTAPEDNGEAVPTPPKETEMPASPTRVSDVVYTLGFSLGGPDLRATAPGRVNLASGEIQLVEFFAFWCTRCQQMAPVVHGLENKYGEDIRFIYLDIDDPDTLELQQAVHYQYRLRPYIMLLDGNGEVITDESGNKYIWIGVFPGESLDLALMNILNGYK